MRPFTGEPQAADDPAVDEEVAFWRGFITWWKQEKAEPVPVRAWVALALAQRRAERAEIGDI
jgi:hypothetical protein